MSNHDLPDFLVRDYAAEARPDPDEPETASERRVIDMMTSRGDHFIIRLALLYSAAGGENRHKIRACWRAEWEKYSELAREAKRREGDQ